MTDPLSRVPGIWRAGMLAAATEATPAFRIVNAPGLIGDCRGDDAFASGIAPGVPGDCHRDWYIPANHREGDPPDTIDINDPTGATTGCLAAFCRGLWKLPDLYCRPLLPGGWVVTRQFTHPAIGADFDDCHGNTEPAAWRAAILAHPSLLETP